MADKARPTFHTSLGAYFAQLRGPWSQSEAAAEAQDRAEKTTSDADRAALEAITRQVILRLEAGKTKQPSALVLRGLSILYEMPYEVLVTEVTRHVYGSELPGHTRTGESESGHSTGSGDQHGRGEKAATRAFAVEQRKIAKQLRDELDKIMADLASAVGRIDDHGILRGAVRPQPTRRGRARKAG